MHARMHFVFLGLSITSTWGNGHATTYRGLIKELARRGHKITFLERDVPWYAQNREFDELPYCRIVLYQSLEDLQDSYGALIRSADVVVVGSYVPEGIAVGRWITDIAENCAAFYDIDTPVTLANLAANKCEYISRDLFPKYSLYLSFTGGPTLSFIEQKLGSPCAQALYCSVDPSLYYPEKQVCRWNLAYLGTYAADRQAAVQRLLIAVAEAHPEMRFAIAGPQYPEGISWPKNIERKCHLPATEHCRFYNSQRFTLNVTRQDMVRAGYSPSVRLFEAAACGVPILTDVWPGLETIFRPEREILPVRAPKDVTSYLQMEEEERIKVGKRGRERVLRYHTAAVRAEQLEKYVLATLESRACSKGQRVAIKASPSPALF